MRLVPDDTKIDFIGKRKIAFAVSLFLIVSSIVSLGTRGLNLGIDFAGGILVEVQTDGPADLASMRSTLGGLGLGGVELTGIGGTDDQVMIRVQRQEGEEEAQMEALSAVRAALGDTVVEYRRVELVGPKVGSELIRQGITAMVLALFAISAYIWFRFEWPFAIGALVATFHDVILVIGLFSLLGMQFDLTTVAAILTIAGYSINDTVVVFDRIREKLRQYKTMLIPDLLNRALNAVLRRTILTSVTTLLALFAIYFFGGEVLRGFAFALIMGILIGTYSSIYIASPVLLAFNLRHDEDQDSSGVEAKSPQTGATKRERLAKQDKADKITG